MSTFVHLDDLNGAAPAHLAARHRESSAFVAARRHSRRVALYRKVIPVGAALAVVVLVIMPLLSPLRAIGALSMGPVQLSGTQVTMDKPKMNGFKKDNSPYEITAATAVQDIRKPTLIDLIEMKARMQMGSEGWMTLEAKTANFENQKEQLKLRDGVVVKTQSGYDIRMKNADADFKAGTVSSREPVKVTNATMRVEADSLDVIDNGKSISFKGRVRTTVVGEGGELPPEGSPSASELAAPFPGMAASGAAAVSAAAAPAKDLGKETVKALPGTAPSAAASPRTGKDKDMVRIGANGERL
jgi:lipopolysaccharide export system protein LptC